METHQFQADVQQILRLVTHSIYSDKEIFLRELISNASDALDAARFAALQDQELRTVEGAPAIRITVDKEASQIIISDDGIGLTAEQASKNLGTIAQSGTRAIAKMMEEQGASSENLIGQFGVGFYSAFMVAQTVEVHSLSAQPESEAIHWVSEGGESYTLETSERKERGTRIILHIQEECSEFLDEDRIKGIIRKHSDFVSWPILIGDERINQEEAIWSRNPSEVTTEEYNAFYKHISGDWSDPLVTIHVRADAPLQFNAVLFIPERRPWELDRMDYKTGLRLYQKRIKVLDHADELLPRYLRFARGVVDTPDIDLNVSREILQQTPVIQAIKKQLTRRLLKKLVELSNDNQEGYNSFWSEMGHILKEGISEADGSSSEKNKKRLVSLLRYPTTSSDGALRSLAEVKENMKEGQDAIWFFTSVNRDRIHAAPVLEGFRKRDWEVMLMTDPVDEWVTMHTQEFDEVPLKSAAHGELPEEDEENEDESESRREALPLVSWMKDLLKEQVSEVRISNRLTDSPSVLVNQKGSMGANMENILKAANQEISETKRVLEINPEHPMVQTLAKLNTDGTTGLEPFARLLLDHAAIVEGQLKDPDGFSKRLQSLMAAAARGMQATSPAGDDGAGPGSAE